MEGGVNAVGGGILRAATCLAVCLVTLSVDCLVTLSVEGGAADEREELGEDLMGGRPEEERDGGRPFGRPLEEEEREGGRPLGRPRPRPLEMERGMG